MKLGIKNLFGEGEVRMNDTGDEIKWERTESDSDDQRVGGKRGRTLSERSISVSGEVLLLYEFSKVTGIHGEFVELY